MEGAELIEQRLFEGNSKGVILVFTIFSDIYV
jgi:hypothetical protein